MGRRRPQLRRKTRPGDPRPLLAKITLGQPWEIPADDGKLDLRLVYLLEGHDHFGDVFKSSEEARLLWEGVHDSFLEEHIRRHPGTRPWAWWEWDAPAPRRILTGDFSTVLPAAGSWMGAPATGNLVVESQAAYLRRLKMLTVAERADPRVSKCKEEVTDPATAYARAVLAGLVVAGRVVRFACERHLQDLEAGHLRGWYFDRRRADRFYSFTRFAKHYKGRLAGERLELLPWQHFVTGSMLGWIDGSQLRRFRISWVEVAKKNGKTFLLAAVGLYFLMADGEGGPELYCGASKLEQARLSLRDMRMVAKSSSQLSKRLNILATRIDTLHVVGGKAEALARAAEDTAERHDGINIHLALLDEIHAHQDGALWDLAEGSTVARMQPMVFAITTAGFRIEWFGGRQSLHFEGIVDPHQPITDDRSFVYIARMDSLEENEKPGMWVKANPSLGVSTTLEAIQTAIARGKSQPAKWGYVLTKHLNWWSGGTETAWLTTEAWATCTRATNPAEWRRSSLLRLVGRKCYAGLDLASRSDTASLSLFFPATEDAPAEFFVYCWLPEQGYMDRVSKEKLPYDQWKDQGFVAVCPGPYVDEAFIFRAVLAIQFVFRLMQLAIDPFQATSLMQSLDKEGVPIVQLKQSFGNYNEPCLKLETMVLGAEFEHGGNPVLTSHLSRVSLGRSSEGYVRPDRKRAGTLGYRIDAACASLMALWCWLASQNQKDEKIESIYTADRGLAPRS